MNCEKCQVLISDFLDGSLSGQDQSTLNAHLDECLSCAEVRNDLQSILGYCQANRGDYTAPPNEKALWLRIRNVIEADASAAAAKPAPVARRSGWFSRSWELSFPQLAASVAAIVLIVVLSTIVGLRRYQTGEVSKAAGNSGDANLSLAANSVRDRFSQQQQMISFWNERVEYNKARWSPQMRETFDRNLQVIDQAVNENLNNLGQNPHDEVSEEMLNSALNEKLALLKEFAEL
jgi:anti-sigma factor RsiW